MNRLLLSLGDEVLQSYPFDGRPVEVGRARGNDLVIPDAAVADFHLVVRQAAEGPIAIDRTGRGIPHGGARVERVRLERGVRMPLGRFSLTLAPVAGVEEAAPDLRRTLLVRLPVPGGLPALVLADAQTRAAPRPVRGTETRIGSDLDNHVVLADRFVSARHCRIQAERSAYVIRDLDSRNGTWVNGVRVAAAEIHAGTRLRLGVTELVCRERGADEDLGLVGRSEAIAEVRREILRLGPLSGSVLVTGESGSGKEVVARALHAASPRARSPFVAINCAALSPELVESELFGHERGAFTGATGRRRGAFETAHEGTLFLDEIGDLPLAQQAKLLRALEERAVRRVGGEARVLVDVRIVAATHVDLRNAVARRTFREDLFHRLAVLRIRVPALRERAADVEPLAAHFLEEVSDELGIRRLGPGSRDRLVRYPWPGNVRELKNVLYRAAAEATGVEISPADLRLEEWGSFDVSDPETLRVREAMRRSGGIVARAARELGVARETLRDRLQSTRKMRGI
jgi:transcriptional regulator with AAA-type ATPase domain